MANPPITIGPFTNVPAPGSPIRSDWPQSISTFVNALPFGLYNRATKAATESGFGATEFVIGGIGFTLPTTPSRTYQVFFSIALSVTAPPAAPSTAAMRLRVGPGVGAAVDAMFFPVQTVSPSGGFTCVGAFYPSVLTPGATYIIATKADGVAFSYSVQGGSWSAVFDVT